MLWTGQLIEVQRKKKQTYGKAWPSGSGGSKKGKEGDSRELHVGFVLGCKAKMLDWNLYSTERRIVSLVE